jgi:hypothetical protein
MIWVVDGMDGVGIVRGLLNPAITGWNKQGVFHAETTHRTPSETSHSLI